MRTYANPNIDTAPIAEEAANIARWLRLLLTWFCAVIELIPPALARAPLVRDMLAETKRSIASDLRRAVSALRWMVVEAAQARLRFCKGPRRARLLPNAPGDGFRRSKAARKLTRIATSGVLAGLHRGALRQRIERLRAFMQNFEAHIVRVAKRLLALRRAAHTRRIVLTASRDVCFTLAQATPALADTS